MDYTPPLTVWFDLSVIMSSTIASSAFILISCISTNSITFKTVFIVLSMIGSFKLGVYLDTRFDLYPFFTIFSFSAGVGLGGFTIFRMVQNYFNPLVKNLSNSKYTELPFIFQNEKTKDLPIIDVTVDQVRKAVRTFSDQLPKGVYRTILVEEDNRIDFTQLTHIIGGIPSKNFYMSKETYDLFEEKDKLIPFEMDIVQKAVDQYVKEHKEFPMLSFDPHRRVNYYQLIQERFLKSVPETQFYITDLDGMITHIKQIKKSFE